MLILYRISKVDFHASPTSKCSARESGLANFLSFLVIAITVPLFIFGAAAINLNGQFVEDVQWQYFKSIAQKVAHLISTPLLRLDGVLVSRQLTINSLQLSFQSCSLRYLYGASRSWPSGSWNMELPWIP